MDDIGRAISERLVVSAVYNGANVAIQPYILLIRNGALYVGAYNPAKSRRHDAAPSLGLFNIAGFSDLVVGHEFSPIPEIAIGAPRDGDHVVLALSD